MRYPPDWYHPDRERVIRIVTPILLLALLVVIATPILELLK